MTQRVGGMDFDISIGTTLIHVDSISLDVTDNSAVAYTRGVPNGWIKGDKSAEGEMELDEAEFKKLNELARQAGSWEELEVFDILFYAETAGDQSRVEAFGCKLKLSSALNMEPSGGEKATKTVAYMVTSPEFIHLDGVPIIGEASLRGIVG